MKTILVVISILTCQVVTYTQCNIDDFNALKAIYTDLDGDNWLNKSNWSIVSNNATPPPGCDLGSMFGIQLSSSGRVESIDFTNNPNFGNGLDGTFPSEFSDLDSLKFLIMPNNGNLSGSIHTSLGNLDVLETFSVRNCGLSGALPSTFWNLTSLVSIDIYGNAFSGSIPTQLGNLTNLEFLDLGNTDFTGPIPEEFGQLISLKEMYFENNAFTFLPDVFTNMTDLEIFIIKNNSIANPNSFQGLFPSTITTLSNVKVLNIANVEISGSIPTDVSNMTSLEEIVLQIDLSGSIPSSFGSLSKLKTMALNSNDSLSGSIPNMFSGMDSLKSLSLGSNNLSGSIPTSIGNLKSIESISLRDNQLTGSIPDVFLNLSKLELLKLELNKLDGSIPESLGNATMLHTVVLENNRLSGMIPDVLSNLTNLITLILDDNELVGSLPPSLGNLTNLTTLGISDNKLCGGIPSTFGNMTSLNLFRVGKNQLGGCFPSNLSNLCANNLNLYLGFPATNQFEASWSDFCTNGSGQCANGTLSNELIALTDMYNQLNGINWVNHTDWTSNNDPCGQSPTNTAWDGITCSNDTIIEINLQNDLVDGILPESIDLLCDLKELDLGNNGLDGINNDLGRMGNLEVLNLSQNELSFDQNLFQPFPPSLLSLNLSANSYTGIQGIDILSKLKSLNLNNNDLTEIKSEWAELPLEYFNLFSNEITGEVPEFLGNMTTLILLDLRSNDLSGCLHPNLKNICGSIVALSSNPNLDNDNMSTFCSSDVGICDLCQEHVTLTGTITTGTYEASSSITCNGTIAAGADVTLSAPDSVVLANDFNVISTGLLQIDNTGCN